jgi:hypothetical protein
MCLVFLYGTGFCDTREVSTFAELNNALYGANSGDVIILVDGIYKISGQFALVLGADNITIRGKSGNREAAVIKGQGMYGDVNHGFWVNKNHITIQDITIQEVANHCIQLDANTDTFHLRNCILRGGYEQLLKVPYSFSINDPSENGIVEECLFEYTAGEAPNWYTGGVDVHSGKNWIVRNNTFKDIQSPGGDPAEHAIHFWSNSEGTLVERNLIINCDRGIGFGLGSVQHIGGIIRNNMIYHNGSGAYADVGIGIESSTNTQIYNNTIYFDHNRYSNAIEYRFSETYGAYIANNLTNKLITSRDGGTGILESNITHAKPDWFVNPSCGDLHLTGTIKEVVDQGTIISGLIDDFDGDSRPRGSGIDIGADEVATKAFNSGIYLLLLNEI